MTKLWITGFFVLLGSLPLEAFSECVRSPSGVACSRTSRECVKAPSGVACGRGAGVADASN